MYELMLSAANMAYVWDHVLAGKALVPGVLFMEMAACSVQQALSSSGPASVSACLGAVAIPAPCLLPELAEGSHSQGMEIVLRCLVKQDIVRLASNSDTTAAGRRPTVHLQAQPVTVLPTEKITTAVTVGRLGRLMRAFLTTPAAVMPGAAAAAHSASAVAVIAPGTAPAAATGCVDPSQLDALLQLAGLQRGVLAPQLTDQLQVPAAADLYTSAAAADSSSADSSFAGNNACLAAAVVRPGLTPELMIADFQMQTAGADITRQAVCSVMGLQARRATAAALVQQKLHITAGATPGKLTDAEIEVSMTAG